MTEEIKALMAELYTANGRLEYCRKNKVKVDNELAFAEGKMNDIVEKAKASSLSPAEIFNAMCYGKI